MVKFVEMMQEIEDLKEKLKHAETTRERYILEQNIRGAERELRTAKKFYAEAMRKKHGCY